MRFYFDLQDKLAIQDEVVLASDGAIFNPTGG